MKKKALFKSLAQHEKIEVLCPEIVSLQMDIAQYCNEGHIKEMLGKTATIEKCLIKLGDISILYIP